MPPETSPAKGNLELRNVSKYFGDLAALRDVSLRVDAGESLFIYGPNGAGKTTLLRILCTLARPAEGQAFFGGQDIHANPSAARARIGFVSHATFLYSDLSTRENLSLTGTLFGLAGLKERIAVVLEMFSIENRADEPVRKLSRGLQQRATLARAFLHDPDYILLDEPFTGLDAASIEKLEDLLRRLPRQGKSIVFSTHNFDQGASIAKRLVVMAAGRVKFDGPLGMAPLESLGIKK